MSTDHRIEKTFHPDTKNAFIIVNPASGVGDGTSRKMQIQSIAKNLGWRGKIVETSLTKGADLLVADAIKSGVKHIVVCGGDGTIMEALGEAVQKKVMVGIVPFGTGNLFAKNLSIPLNTADALEIALTGQVRAIDVGNANGITFSIMAGIGFSADMIRNADRKSKDRWGHTAYIVSGMKSLLSKRGRYRITLDNKKTIEVRARDILVANMGTITGNIEVVPKANPESGSLRLGIIKARDFKAWINIAVNALVRDVNKSPHYDLFEAKEIVVKSLSGKKAFQCDGNDFPVTEVVTVKIFPRAVHVVVAGRPQ